MRLPFVEAALRRASTSRDPKVAIGELIKALHEVRAEVVKLGKEVDDLKNA